MAAPWIAASQPSIPARIASASERLPGTSSQPSSVRAAPFSGLRTSARRRRRARAACGHVAADEPGPSGDEDPHRAKPIRVAGSVRRIWAGGCAAYTWMSAANPPRPDRGNPLRGRGAGVENRRAAARARDRGPARFPGRRRRARRAEGAPAHRRRRDGRRAGPGPRAPGPRSLPGTGQAGRAEVGDRAQRRQPGRLRRRARPAPGAEPRGGARRAGDRSHGGDPRHLRRPRAQRGGKAPGRAGAARVQPRAHARPVDPSRAAGRRDRYPRPGETQIETDRRLARDRIANCAAASSGWSGPRGDAGAARDPDAPDRGPRGVHQCR